MEFLTNNPYLPLVTAILSLANALALAYFARQFLIYQKRQKELLAGEQVGDLTEIVLKHKKTLATHGKNLKELGGILEELVDRGQGNIQKIGLVRFNPFADTGANMSFSLALLDGKGDGIVISSLHGRDGTRIYGKSIENGKSEYHLTDEEKQALRESR